MCCSRRAKTQLGGADTLEKGALEAGEELDKLGAGKELPLDGGGEPLLGDCSRRCVAHFAPQVEQAILHRTGTDHGLACGLRTPFLDLLPGTAHVVESPLVIHCSTTPTFSIIGVFPALREPNRRIHIRPAPR